MDPETKRFVDLILENGWAERHFNACYMHARRTATGPKQQMADALIDFNRLLPCGVREHGFAEESVSIKRAMEVLLDIFLARPLPEIMAGP